MARANGREVKTFLWVYEWTREGIWNKCHLQMVKMIFFFFFGPWNTESITCSQKQETEFFLKIILILILVMPTACGNSLGQGLNLHHRSSPSYSSDNARSLTCCGTRKFQKLNSRWMNFLNFLTVCPSHMILMQMAFGSGFRKHCLGWIN